ncbi:MAG TPA: IS110 family transposase [Verrucomicrobiae bacterium]|nr:IS110 family transposase [Verrucomicrobiae bacterium]
MNPISRKTIGVDLHKASLTATVLDSAGRVVERKDIPTKCRNQIADYFASHGPGVQVAVESVGFYHWFWDTVRPKVQALHLADPAGVRARAGRRTKTDRNDSLLLARLLQENRLPMAYVPEEPVRALRELCRQRHRLARQLALARRQLRWVALKNNLPGPANLTSDRAPKWLLAQEAKLSPAHRLSARQFLDQIVTLERQLADTETVLHQNVAAHADLAPTLALIQSVPGVGFVTALTILCECGDLTRFDSIDQLSSYAGLCPRVRQSGQTVHHGHISKQGPPVLRWVLQQAAWVAIRCDPNARRIYARIAKRAGNKKAATALARKLLAYAWSVGRQGRPFVWPDQKTTGPEPVPVWSFDI